MKTEQKTKKRLKMYCIFLKDGYIYFPIAAQISPYIRRNGQRAESYLAGMPNFFGGNVENNEDVWETLTREIEEESQGNIKIEIPLEEVRLLLLDMDEKNMYMFFFIDIGNLPNHPFNWSGESETVFPLHIYEEYQEDARQHPERYEDSFLVRMEEARFRDFLQRLLELKNIENEEEREEQVERLLLDQGINGGVTISGVNNWYDSHTAKAFSCYLNRYPAST